MLLLLSIARRYWREGSIGLLVLAVFVVAAGWARDRREFARQKLVYENPAVKIVEKIVRVQGPVRVITRVVQKPGETVTIVEERRGEVVESSESGHESRPVPIREAMAPARADRWLAGIQVDDLRFRDSRGYTALAGYSFRNRVDVLGGWGGDGGKIQLGIRF